MPYTNWKMVKSSMQNEAQKTIIECDNLVKIYKTKDTEVLALQGLEMNIERGELMAIVGNSGSGKSTFLNMVGGLDRPSAGKLFVDGKDLFKMTKQELAVYKRTTVGFVWQNNARNLLPWLSAIDNVETPMLFSPIKKRRAFAADLLNRVGLSDKANRTLKQLSGGEQQRVAIAIALANNPKILLADEPTGAVDGKTADLILDVFRKLNEELNVTIVIVTHDPAISRKVNRVVSIRDGKMASERIMKLSYLDRLENVEGFEDIISHDEYAVLDRAGRLQIPREMLEALNIEGNRVSVEKTEEGIVIKKPE